MSPVDQVLRRRWRLALVAIAAAAALSFPVAPVSAECIGPDPSFRGALPTAQRVVIGDVIAVHSGGSWDPAEFGGLSSRFTLRVRYVPRGSAPAQMEIVDLPTQPCAEMVIVRKGDRIALLFDGTDFTPPVQVNVAAWIRGTPQDFPGVETTTVREVYMLLGLDPPDTSTTRPGSPRDVGFPLVLLAATVGLLVGWRRFAREQPGTARLAGRAEELRSVGEP